MRIAGRIACVIGLLLSPLNGADAQATGRTPAADATFRRAIGLVNDGEGAAGRAVLDSMVNSARPNSLELAEALYWRATVAPSAAEAEQDYKRVILDHPLSPRVPDALLRLAQLELARGERESAVRRLQRLDIEYPGYQARARTSYWLARAYLDQNEMDRGCAAVTEARARALPNDVELRNQIDFLALRCPSPAVASAGAPPTTGPAVASQSPAPVERAAGTQPQSPTGTQPPPAEVVADSGSATAPAEQPGSSAPPAAPAAGGAWSVQVAAFNTRPQAAALAERLRGRGLEARVDGSAAPFRVRIGRYSTRAAAATALQGFKGRGIDGFVTDVGTR